MSKRLIVLSGNIGSGKTSLAEHLSSRLDWVIGGEPVTENPFLLDFYSDMREWAFHLQVYFLGKRAKQHFILSKESKSVILDRSIFDDAYVFARALYRLGYLTERDYQAYYNVSEVFIAMLQTPDLLIYLKAPPDVLFERIQKRGRKSETRITVEYLSLLDSLYEEWISVFDVCPVLVVPTGDVDIWQRDYIDLIINKIQYILVGRDELIFPANNH